MTRQDIGFKQGDIVQWRWRKGQEPTHTHDAYWCKARTAIVLQDGRMVDTFWHSLSQDKWASQDDFIVPVEKADVSFVINVADLVPLVGPREQYADEDTFYLCDGGGGAWRNYMRKGCRPVRDRVLAVLEAMLDRACADEQSAKRKQEAIAALIEEVKAGKDVRL